MTFDAPAPPHTSARKGDPGCVDVWDLIQPGESPPDTDWPVPLDGTVDAHQAVQLAEKIADQLKNWIGKQRLEASGKIIEADDILVLVRSRDRFVTALNRALKNRKYPNSRCGQAGDNRPHCRHGSYRPRAGDADAGG